MVRPEMATVRENWLMLMLKAAVSWSGSEEALLPPRPLRTVQADFSAYGSSTGQRAWRHAVPSPQRGHLDATPTAPATEVPSVAGAAPARALVARPSSALPPAPIACRFASASTRGKSARLRVGQCRNPYPAPYRPAFACSLVLYPQPPRLASRPPYHAHSPTRESPRAGEPLRPGLGAVL